MRAAPSRPPFACWQAIVLHPPHPGTESIVRQLERLGVGVRLAWPELGPDDVAADVVFFDADTGYDGQFPWPAGFAPMPLVALIGSEAPGRVEWALAQGSNAHLLKPVASAGVYSALLIAAHSYATRLRLDGEIRDLTARLRKRPVVVRALVGLMCEGRDEQAAFARLRQIAMDRQMTVEDAAEALVSEAPPLPIRRKAK